MNPAPGGWDLPSQLEDLLHAVWQAERDWAFMDRLDLARPVERRLPGGAISPGAPSRD